MRRIVPALASLAALCAVTGAIFALRPVAPVVSLGVLYLLAVLPVAIFWGHRYALPVAVASMLAFNFFFLPPVHTFRLRDSENWVALAVYLTTAVVVSELAPLAALLAYAADRERLGRKAVDAEALRRSDAVKTTILRTLSHDLRSPLTAIRAAGELLHGGEVSPAERAELVATVRTEAERLSRLVANVLDLSRLEARAANP